MQVLRTSVVHVFLAFVCVIDSLNAIDSIQQNNFNHSTNNSLSRDGSADNSGNFAAKCSSDSHARYFRDVILRPIMQERVSGSEGSHNVRRHIMNRMFELGWHVSEDQFEADTPVGRRSFTNIVAVLDPRSRSRLTLACHYDSKQFDDDVMETFIGATDAAVSCAMIIDLVTCLNDSLHTSRAQTPPPEKSIQLIFFDGEEAFVNWNENDSLYGSRHLAEVMEENMLPPLDNESDESDEQRTQLKAIDLLVLLDLIGSKETRFVNWFQKTAHLFNRLSQIEDQLWSDGALKPVAATPFTDNTVDGRNTARYFVNDQFSMFSAYRYLSGGIQDDHTPFLVRGVPVLHLISYPFPAVWHTEADNETALSYVTISNVAAILRVFVSEYLRLAEASVSA